MSDALLHVEDLVVELADARARGPVLRGISFAIRPGEALGLVGESGSGKSMTARAVMRQLPRGARCSGRIAFGDRDVLGMSPAQLRAFYADDLGVVFQDPRAHVNPLHTVGDFLVEGLVAGGGMAPAAAHRRCEELLEEVGVAGASRRMRQYPHELSGGLLQRVMIAAALASDPALLIADEPTTALDVTTQADVVSILDDLRRSRGLALIFITHDIDLAAAVCDRIAVLYAGEIVDERPTAELMARPRHPYAAGLLASRPSLEGPVGRLAAIPGSPLAGHEVETGCAFAPRCSFCTERCEQERPALEAAGGGTVRCWHHAELDFAATPAAPEARCGAGGA